eukprot:2467378-Pleurochrysis_carterae.AAC.1
MEARTGGAQTRSMGPCLFQRVHDNCDERRLQLSSELGVARRRCVRDGARRRVVKVGTAQGAKLREGNSARRQTTRAEQRNAPNCERG